MAFLLLVIRSLAVAILDRKWLAPDHYLLKAHRSQLSVYPGAGVQLQGSNYLHQVFIFTAAFTIFAVFAGRNGNA
jgi:hypothetical protein